MKSSKKLKILVLDDDENRHQAFRHWFGLRNDLDVTHVVNYFGAVDQLQLHTYDVVFLDHDLNDYGYHSTVNNGYGWVEATGMDVAKFIARELPEEKRPVVAVVHSWNPAGADMMCATLREVPKLIVKRWEFRPAQDPLAMIGLTFEAPRDE